MPHRKILRNEKIIATCKSQSYPDRHLRSLLMTFTRRGVLAQQSTSSIQVSRVGAPSLVVSDMDRAVAFYSQVLSFEKVSDAEVSGDDYEHLEGLFGIRMRVVRLQLGDESIELTEYLAPQGRPVPADSRRQRPLVPAHCDYRERHGPGIRMTCANKVSTRPRVRNGYRIGTERRRYPGFLLSRSGWALPGNPGVSAGQGKPQMASSERQAVPGHRSHRHRGWRYGSQSQVL